MQDNKPIGHDTAPTEFSIDTLTASTSAPSDEPAAQPKRLGTGRVAVAQLVGALAMVGGPEERAWDRLTSSLKADASVRPGRSSSEYMTDKEREERKRARRHSAPKRAQRKARKAQRRRK